MKFPRPKDINFPEVQNKMEFNFKQMSFREENERKIAKSICPLKSGNILVSYLWVDVLLFKIKPFLEIYSVPKLKLVEKYEFDNEIDETFYLIDCAIQLKNGNIFTICDRLYIFDGESIDQGPKIKSEEEISYNHANLTRYIHPSDLNKFKNYREFLCDFMLEIKEGTVLYTYEENTEVYLLDIANLKTEGKKIFEYKNKNGKNTNYSLDIIHPSEYYPENLYICANSLGENQKSILLIFNLDEFCSKKNKSPLSTITVSESQNVFAICEYDNKYLLLDTLQNGIYIIDMESKQKVAVSVLRIFEQGKYYSVEKKKTINHRNRFDNLYRNMVKLKDGRIIVFDYRYYLADIREQVKETANLGSAKFAYIGNYMICYGYQTMLVVYKIFDD